MSLSEDYARTRELRKNPYKAFPKKDVKRDRIFMQCPDCGEYNIPIDSKDGLCPECRAKRKAQGFGNIGEIAFEMVK